MPVMTTSQDLRVNTPRRDCQHIAGVVGSAAAGSMPGPIATDSIRTLAPNNRQVRPNAGETNLWLTSVQQERAHAAHNFEAQENRTIYGTLAGVLAVATTLLLLVTALPAARAIAQHRSTPSLPLPGTLVPPAAFAPLVGQPPLGGLAPLVGHSPIGTLQHLIDSPQLSAPSPRLAAHVDLVPAPSGAPQRGFGNKGRRLGVFSSGVHVKPRLARA